MTPTIHRISGGRPWGGFEQFTKNALSTVKLLTINPGESISLQYHHNRSEYWYVVDGYPIVRLRDKDYFASPGEEFFIARTEMHRITAQVDLVRILEISLGEFDEDDIVRVEDDYGRKSAYIPPR